MKVYHKMIDITSYFKHIFKDQILDNIECLQTKVTLYKQEQIFKYFQG